MKSFKKIVFVLCVIVCMIFSFYTRSNASDGSSILINPGSLPTSTTNDDSSLPVVSQTSIVPASTAPTTDKLPQTGIEDYTGLIMVIVLLAFSSVVAYKKSKELK